jgi:hypothetical protein
MASAMPATPSVRFIRVIVLVTAKLILYCFASQTPFRDDAKWITLNPQLFNPYHGITGCYFACRVSFPNVRNKSAVPAGAR